MLNTQMILSSFKVGKKNKDYLYNVRISLE